MNLNNSNQIKKGFTIVEVLVVVLILGILTSVTLPAYITSVYASRMGTANANARAIATATQAKAIIANSYDTTLSDYTIDMGGALPLNPCTGTTSGYTITATTTTARVTASTGTNCGTWTPTTFALTL